MQNNNDSGFHGYHRASIYPGMGSGLTQTTDTIPEPEEQQQYSNVETPVAPPVDKKQATNMWMLIGVLVLMVFLFGRG